MQKFKKSLHLNHLRRKASQSQKQRKFYSLKICEDYNDVFHLEGESLTAAQHEIATRADSTPVNARPYRLPEKHKTEVNRQIQEMLNNKIIRHSNSQWNAPSLVVPKKIDASGKTKLHCVVVDFRKLNDLTIGDSFSLPNITDILDQLGSLKYFTTLDLASGYHQISKGTKRKLHSQRHTSITNITECLSG
jgi:hypothetical protein